MNHLTVAFKAAVKALDPAKPGSLVRRVGFEMEERGEILTDGELADLLKEVPNTDPALNELGKKVHHWDIAEGEWTKDSPKSTPERRQVINDLLGLSTTEAAVLLDRRPIFVDGTVVISAPWSQWYSPERAEERDFYWRAYSQYLLTVKDWPVKAVASVDAASTRVLERLADPTRTAAHQSKGLVVGHVQSGKTANFTGVTAKAIDAGYRLVIVMTGTIELLRGQTQRRIDMELIGKQNILGDLPEAEREDYSDDEDWDAFIGR